MFRPTILLLVLTMALTLAAQGCPRKSTEEPQNTEKPQPQNTAGEIPSQPESRFDPRHIDIVQNIRGQRSGYDAPKNLVIKDRAAFEAVWGKIYYSVFPKPGPPEVDFDNEMIVAVFMGQRPTAGYSINVVNVIEYADNLEVQFTRHPPPPGYSPATVITQPFCLVKVERIDKEVTFLEVNVGDRSS